MRGNNRFPQALVVLLLVIVCLWAVYNQGGVKEAIQGPRAGFNDATPLGGKGLRLMLQNMGYSVKRTDERLEGMPVDAGVWLLLDPQTNFSKPECEVLLKWVKNGGTLIWAAPTPDMFDFAGFSEHSYREVFKRELKVERSGSGMPRSTGEPFPPLVPITLTSPGVYRSGVKKATASGGSFDVGRPHVELAGTPFAEELSQIYYGKGRVIVSPDALLFTNYALAHDDNAVLVSNFVRANLDGGKAAVYFDERQHGDIGKKEIHPNIFYYLWQLPLRWALLQLLGAGLLVWAFFGRRLGAPVPLPEREPVTRASQYAVAMGSLFRKANRPRAVAAIIGEEFRRTLVRRLGMSITDSDKSIAERASQITGLPAPMIDRLLLRSRNPAEDENTALSDAQEMEIVLRRLSP